MSYELNLSLLPSDIIRKVIDVGHNDIYCIMRISKRWKEIIQQLLAHRKRLPVIDTAFIDIEPDAVDLYSIDIPEKFHEFFGLSSWNKCNLRNSEKTKQKVIRTYKPFKRVNNQKISHKVFNRSSRVEKVELRFVIIRGIKFEHLERAVELLGRCEIGDLIMKELPQLTVSFRTAILKLLKSHSFEHLVLHRGEAVFVLDIVKQFKNYQTFFTAALRFVPQIQLQTIIDAEKMRPKWIGLERMLNEINGLKAILTMDDSIYGKLCMSITSRN